MFTKYFGRKYFDELFQTKIFDGDFQMETCRRNILDENISTKYFIWKYFDDNFQMTISWRRFSDENIWRNIYDENIIGEIFRTKILSTKYLWRMCYRQNIYDENINEIFVTRILRRNISGGNIWLNVSSSNLASNSGLLARRKICPSVRFCSSLDL